MSTPPQTKVVIVTGGLGGIGRTTARLLAEAGSHVIVTDVVAEGGDQFAAELGSLGAEASFVQADLVDEAQVEAMVAHAVDRFGRLDGAFDNAGLPQHEKPLVELTSAEFERVLQVNALGAFHCVKHQMLAMADGGSIVLTSSGVVATALSHRAEYIASKHAVVGLTRAAAVEGAARGIRVNAVLPGSIRTPMNQAIYGNSAGESIAEERAKKLHLLGRIGEPHEVGHAVRWLLSDEASFITGALIPVEGGATAGRHV